MIEDKELGIKVAEDSDEKFWEDMKEKTEEAIKAEKRNIIVNRNLQRLAISQLDKKQKHLYSISYKDY